jgi:histidine ammonia-lyase
VHAAVRRVVPTLNDDRSPAPDLDAIVHLIRRGTLEYAAGIVVN